MIQPQRRLPRRDCRRWLFAVEFVESKQVMMRHLEPTWPGEVTLIRPDVVCHRFERTRRIELESVSHQITINLIGLAVCVRFYSPEHTRLECVINNWICFSFRKKTMNEFILSTTYCVKERFRFAIRALPLHSRLLWIAGIMTLLFS